ncbi:hypothetical protein JL475_30360 [Streptomyces sp. M2CJ-2]|uniref:hypothetical protein n=1 Tax=Streptomyces sp. M2CJ-2 TaxID=2803948 RepID=UPI001926A0A6|nr:hypothetical protein [Streptomyces sp. M2CJ-2]MBL3670205.1 hypothetical protein [Streptomyces sp. M2CJ-2]
MTDTARITVTLPTEQLAEAVARRLRHQLLGTDLVRHREEHGSFTEEEPAEARFRIFGTPGADRRV